MASSSSKTLLSHSRIQEDPSLALGIVQQMSQGIGELNAELGRLQT